MMLLMQLKQMLLFKNNYNLILLHKIFIKKYKYILFNLFKEKGQIQQKLVKLNICLSNNKKN